MKNLSNPKLWHFFFILFFYFFNLQLASFYLSTQVSTNLISPMSTKNMLASSRHSFAPFPCSSLSDQITWWFPLPEHRSARYETPLLPHFWLVPIIHDAAESRTPTNLPDLTLPPLIRKEDLFAGLAFCSPGRSSGQSKFIVPSVAGIRFRYGTSGQQKSKKPEQAEPQAQAQAQVQAQARHVVCVVQQQQHSGARRRIERFLLSNRVRSPYLFPLHDNIEVVFSISAVS